jgi:hypothetical protein
MKSVTASVDKKSVPLRRASPSMASLSPITSNIMQDETSIAN